MKKVVKLFSLALVLTVFLVVAVAGAAFADNPEKGKMNQNQNGDCVCNNDCEPLEYYYNYVWGEPGPHKAQNGKVVD